MKHSFVYAAIIILVAGCMRDEELLLPTRPAQPGIMAISNEVFGLPRSLFFRFEQTSMYTADVDNKYVVNRLHTDFYAYNFLNRDLGQLIWHDVPMSFRVNHYFGRTVRTDSLHGRIRDLSHEANGAELPSFVYPLYAPMPMFFTIEGLTLDFKVDTIKGFTVKWPVDSFLPPANPIILYTEFDVQGQPMTYTDTLAEWDGQYDYSPLLLTMNQNKKLKLYMARGINYRDTIGTRTAGFSFIHYGQIDLTIK